MSDKFYEAFSKAYDKINAVYIKVQHDIIYAELDNKESYDLLEQQRKGLHPQLHCKDRTIFEKYDIPSIRSHFN